MKVFSLLVLFAGSHCLSTNAISIGKSHGNQNFDKLENQEEPNVSKPDPEVAPPPPGFHRPDENQDEADRSTLRATGLVSPMRHLKEETDRQSDDFYYCDDGKEVTMTAKFWYVNDFEGGQDNAEAIVEKFVATTNEALSNSKVPIKYQVWGSVQQHPLTNDELSGQYQIDGTESNELFVKSMGEELEDMEYLKQTADHMVMMYNTLGSEPNRCWGFYYNDEWWNGNPFRTIIVTGTMDNDETFAHEAGHCMGAMHNIEAGDRGSDVWNYGYCLPGTSYSTVMAYESTCPEGFSTSSIKYYSNPDVYYEGVATGSAEANNALYMTTRKYDYSTGGTNCADGTATDKTEVTNQCTWGDGWTATPYSQCCCEGNLYAEWEEFGFSSAVCYLDIPVYGGSWVAQGQKVAYNLKDCKNLLGESVSPYNTCALGDEASDYTSWRELLAPVDCDCDPSCGVEVEDIDGGWTEWHECSATCGGGTQERTCTNPPQSGNGADCEGESTQSCGEDDCPAVTVYHESACGVGKEKGSLEISGLSSGTSVSFEFVTYEDEDQTEEGYQNTGLWITDGPSSYGNWGTDHEGKLVYTRGSEEGTATVSETGNGIYAYVYPYTSDGSWCLDLTVEV